MRVGSSVVALITVIAVFGLLVTAFFLPWLSIDTEIFSIKLSFKISLLRLILDLGFTRETLALTTLYIATLILTLNSIRDVKYGVCAGGLSLLTSATWFTLVSIAKASIAEELGSTYAEKIHLGLGAYIPIIAGILLIATTLNNKLKKKMLQTKSTTVDKQ